MGISPLIGDLLNLLRRTLLWDGLSVLAPPEHKPGNQTDNQQRAHNGANGDTSSGTLRETAAATGGALLGISVILIITSGRVRSW